MDRLGFLALNQVQVVQHLTLKESQASKIRFIKEALEKGLMQSKSAHKLI
jgi:hypothetical protein